MSKVQDIELILKNKKRIVIPIWNDKALINKKCHIDRIYSSNDVEEITINFFDEYSKSYHVIRKIKKFKKNKGKRVIK